MKTFNKTQWERLHSANGSIRLREASYLVQQGTAHTGELGLVAHGEVACRFVHGHTGEVIASGTLRLERVTPDGRGVVGGRTRITFEHAGGETEVITAADERSRITQLRQQMGTQEEVAARLEVSKRTLERAENDGGYPRRTLIHYALRGLACE